MSEHTVEDLHVAMRHLTAGQPPVDVSAGLTRVRRRHRRRRLLVNGAGGVALTLAVLGGMLIIERDRGTTVVSPSDRVEDHTTQIDLSPADVDVEVFLGPDATAAQVEALGAALAAHPDVGRYRYLDHTAAYAEFLRIFGLDPESGAGAAVDPGELPVSYKIVLDDGADRASFKAWLRSFSGVETVVYRS